MSGVGGGWVYGGWLGQQGAEAVIKTGSFQPGATATVHVGDKDHGKLESLRLVNGHQADHVAALGVDGGQRLARFFDDRGQQLIGELGEVGLSGEIAGAGLLDQFLQIGQLPLAEELGEQRGVEPGLVDCQLQQFHEAAPRHLRAEFGQHPQRQLDASEPPIGLGPPLRTGLSGGGGGGRG